MTNITYTSQSLFDLSKSPVDHKVRLWKHMTPTEAGLDVGEHASFKRVWVIIGVFNSWGEARAAMFATLEGERKMLLAA